MNEEILKLKVTEHDEMLKEHGKTLNELKVSNMEFKTEMKNLYAKIDELMGWIKALIITIIGTFGGFIVWYLQTRQGR